MDETDTFRNNISCLRNPKRHVHFPKLGSVSSGMTPDSPAGPFSATSEFSPKVGICQEHYPRNLEIFHWIWFACQKYSISVTFTVNCRGFVHLMPKWMSTCWKAVFCSKRNENNLSHHAEESIKGSQALSTPKARICLKSKNQWPWSLEHTWFLAQHSYLEILGRVRRSLIHGVMCHRRHHGGLLAATDKGRSAQMGAGRVRHYIVLWQCHVIMWWWWRDSRGRLTFRR